MKKAIIFLYATLIIVNIGLWGFIVPDLYNHDQFIEEQPNNTQNDTVLSEIETQIPNVETIHETENTNPTEYTIPYVTEPYEKEIVKDYNVNYSYGERVTPAVEIDTSIGVKNNTGYVDTYEYTCIGKYIITGYTPTCTHCCAGGKGITASGVKAIPGYSVAADDSIPFGTTLYIEGYGYYVVEDRGVSGNHIDIAANTHEECYALTNKEVNVYIVPYIIEVINDDND